MDYSIKSLSFDKLVNTQAFSEAANDYRKNIVRSGGTERHVYCKAPVGSNEWNEYWDLQEMRCQMGFKVGDTRITGRQYYFGNFFPMVQAVGKEGSTMYDTESAFPRFMLIQWLWFTFKHIARHGGTFMGIESPGGKNMVGLKTRSAGFSYMNASDGAYNFNFIDGSKTFYVGYSTEFITDEADSTLVKVEAGLDWLNNQTGGVDKNGRFVTNQEGIPFGEWRKNRTGSMADGWIAEFKDKAGYTHGSKSAISPVIVNSPRKARGKRGDIVIEEFGSMPNGLQTLAILRGNVDMSGRKIGQICAFGTGGESGEGIEALDKVYWNPDAYDMLAFPNIWEDAENEKVGFFCPVWLGRLEDCDINGNPNPSKTISDEEKIRSAQPTPQETDKRIAEYPNTPSEALKRLSGNKFPQAAIEAQIKRLQTNRSMQSRIKEVDFDYSEKAELILVPAANPPVRTFPHTQDMNLKGCFEVLQEPYRLDNGKIPDDDLYFITVDCYSVDDVEEVVSLYSMKVWKNWNKYDNEFSRMPVAWFVGRRESQEECFDITFKASQYYGGAKIMGEYNAQGQLLINFIKGKQRADLLMRESDLYHNRNVQKTNKNYFQKITTDVKRTNIGLLADLTKEEIGTEDEEGTKVMTYVQQIYDIGWLYEMLKFNSRGNFDRISDAALAPVILKDKSMRAIEGDEDQYYVPDTMMELESYLEIENGTIGSY